MSAIVSDTSPIHYLVECDIADILAQLFTEIVIPPTVLMELQHARTPDKVREWIKAKPTWVRIQAPLRLDESLDVDQGEKEAISLAKELNASALLIDDRKGRAAAIRCGIQVTGTIGLISIAAERGLINIDSVVERLRRTRARLDERLLAAALARARRS